MLIHNWKELSEIPNESDTHILYVEVENCCAFLIAKYPLPYLDSQDFLEQVKHQDVYLSTHTFYKAKYEYCTKILKACGFDIELDTWDT